AGPGPRQGGGCHPSRRVPGGLCYERCTGIGLPGRPAGARSFAEVARMIPLAVLGMDFRDGPTAVRSALGGLDSGSSSPTAELLASGAAKGVALLETCSRCEWVISSAQPAWAAELLKSALLSRAGGAERRMHVRVGSAAIHYLMRVAAGLESVAEGEPAVGRQ